MKSGAYYEHPRTELLDLLSTPPHRLLDVGCGSGATSRAAKLRWGSVETIGIEVVPEVAERARAVVDHVIVGSAETLDLREAALQNIDAVLLADVLEHLIDPWRFLARLRPALRDDAAVAASIPNAANLWLIEELASGRFDYGADGLLDVTHLRFFTRSSIERLFGQAGFCIERWERVTDGRVDDSTRRRRLGITLPPYRAGRVTGRKVTIRELDASRYEDLRTVQFLVVARPFAGANARAERAADRSGG